MQQKLLNVNEQAYQIIRDDLIAFAQYVQHGQYKIAPHLLEFAKVLQDVEAGNIPRVINNWPPRHGKTLLLKLFFAWYLGRNPDKNIIYGSYTASLAFQTSRHVRNIVKSDRFQNIFPGVKLASDSQAVDAWGIDGHTGGFRAVGVGGSVTGHGGDLIAIDDPHKGRQEAESEVVRAGVWNWFTIDIYSRLEPGGAIIVNLTRWHEDDICGRLLAAQKTDQDSDQYLHIVKPALNDKEQALWPERYPVKRLKQIRATVGPYDWEALYQGRPTPPGGGFFKRKWFNRVIERSLIPAGIQWVRVWDLATSLKTTADYTASGCVGFDNEGNLYIRDVIRGKFEWPDTRQLIISTGLNEPDTIIGVESAGFQLAGVQELMRDSDLRHSALYEVKADKDKLSRALPFQARAAAGKVVLVSGDWINDFLAELITFPIGKHDDQVDSIGEGMELAADCTCYFSGAAIGEVRGEIERY